MLQGDLCAVCDQGIPLKEVRGMEAGHVFYLGTKYSHKCVLQTARSIVADCCRMSAFFTNEEGIQQPHEMGCYGLGLSRIMSAVVEIHHDEKGIVWPDALSPYRVIVVSLASMHKDDDSSRLEQFAEQLCDTLQSHPALYDDVILDDSIGFVGLAKEPGTVPGCLEHSVGYLVPDDRGKVVIPDLPAVFLNGRMKGDNRVTAVVLASGQAHVTDNTDQPATGDQHPITMLPNLVEFTKKFLVVCNVP